MKLFDGKQITEITMTQWEGTQDGPEWSDEFFGDFKVDKPYDEELEAYVVDAGDVEWCVARARDWQNNCGDYEGEPGDPDLRYVRVTTRPAPAC